MGYLASMRLSLDIPQGSVLGPLFSNIYKNDLLSSVVETDICNYADDITMYAYEKALDSVIARLESDSNLVINWFGGNFIKLNAEKCHLLILGRNSIQKYRRKKLLCVVIDKEVTFDTHISKLCKKAGSKLLALARIAGYMDPNKLRILMRAFVISQFQFCPLVWMLHSRHLSNKINRIHERTLRILHKDFQLF